MAATGFSEAQRRGVIYEVLDLATEDAYGLWEFKHQPREPFIDVLLELIGRGLLVLGPDREIPTSGVRDVVVARLLLRKDRTWEPSPDEWADGTYVAVLATEAGEREYRRLAAERFGSG